MTRLQVLSATLIGVVLFGGLATSADDPPAKNAKRKTTAAKTAVAPPMENFGAFTPHPSQYLKRDPTDPPYPAFYPNSQAEDEELVFQKEIVKVLCDKAESYPGRVEHFGWLANNELYQKYVYQVYGLSGYILEAKTLPGGWLVRVRVRPRVAAAGRADIRDYILEDYRYQDGVLTLIQTDAAVPKPDKHIFRLH